MSADEGGEPTSMPATNGELHPITPDPPAPSTPSKRKRGPSHDEKPSQEQSSSALQSQEKEQLHETLRNLVEILNKNDTDLQLLKLPLPTSPTKPRPKRAKLSEETGDSANIQSRVAMGRYNTLQEFLGDIDKASAAVIEKRQTRGTITNGLQTDDTPLTEVVNRIAAFKKLLNSLLRQASHLKQSEVKAEPSEEDAGASMKPAVSHVDVRDDNVVLTLFGNPANPKHLYSSLQKSVKVPLPSSEPGSQNYVEVQTPLREAALPNGITTTKVNPYNPEAGPKETKKFGEVFAPRPGLPPLEPPRRSRLSARNSLGSWVDPFEAITDIKSFPGERNNYCLASLPSGHWLQYGGITSSPSFWNHKQKQPSSGHGIDADNIQRQHEETGSWPDEDASFLQGVYSSFAPSFDSSGAVVQADSKNLVWWRKRGANRLQTLLSVADIDESKHPVTDKATDLEPLDPILLEEMVKNFLPEELPEDAVDTDASKADKDSKEVEDALGEVSELLETLSSYQKIRNLESPLPGGANAESREGLPDFGTPNSPSEAENMVYETLKSSLAAIVSSLPPYAVAKLDGDQLAELNISTKILIENPDYHGTMEKDDFTIQQERAAAAAAAVVAPASTANRTVTPNVGSASRSGSYQGSQTAYNQRMYAANARVPQTPGGFQAPQQYYGGRQPSTSGPYTPGHPQTYAGARAPATPTQRQPFMPPSYSQPAGQYPPQYQRSTQNGYTPYSAQPGPSSAQASPQPYAQRPGQPRTYNASIGGARSASPQKPPLYGTPQTRTPYMNSAVNNQQQYLPPQQQPPSHYANYASNQAPSSTPTYANSAAAITYRTGAEQALLDSTKNQNRQSATPQQSQPSDQAGSQERSATPSSKQNGTPVPS